ncbi:MAG: matrixin family metalloprotease, partial [Bryobacteraceae bacterium]
MSALNLTKRVAFAAALFLLAYIVGAGNALAQGHLYLKSKRDVAANELWKRPPAFRVSANRSHVLIEFARRPTNEELAELRSRARVLSYVPDYGFEISITDGQRLEGLPLSWIGRLQPEEKTSPLLRSMARKKVEEVVVEFHRDVTQSEKREVALRAGVTIHERPDLLPNHLLVRGTPEQLLRLAAWDEVAYMFPASKELKEGVPVATCVGALTQSGPLGQSIPKIGDGWDGPGLGAANLYYAFASDSAKLPASSERGEIARAFATWAQYAQLTFNETGDTTAPQTLTVLFATGQHGDAYPFDGLGTLAHTYYPNPTNPEPIAGDMHFNDGESWQIGADVDLYSVALHEAGHALGLGHSDQPGAVMYPYYKRVTGLSAEDIGAIQDLYA